MKDGEFGIRRQKKMQYLWFGGDGKQGEIRLLGEKLERLKEFKHLGSFVTEAAGLEREREVSCSI